MRTFAVGTSAVTAVFIVIISACGGSTPASTTPSASASYYPPGAYPPGAYPPGTYPPGTYPTATGYPTATPPYPTATATAPPAGTGMSSEGFFPCTADFGCGFGKCNPTTQKCVFPCKSTDFDCQQGHTCNPNGFCF